jgi:hypothetical protein
MKVIFILFGVMLSLLGKGDASDQAFDPFFVGAFHKRWKFTSDHLPIGAKVHTFRIASWNVLNEQYLNFIIEDGQGLNKSLITQLAKIRTAHDLSKREQVIFRQCLLMMEGKHKRSLIGLLETKDTLLGYLKNHMPRGWKCLFSPSPTHQEDVFLYDTTKLRVVDSTIVQYSDTSPKIVFLLKVQEKKTGKLYAIFLTHVPGGGPQGLVDMASIVKNLFDPMIETVLMGDMNASPQEVNQVLQNKGLFFTIAASSYPTHVNTHKKASWIDSFFVYSPSGKRFLRQDSSNQLFPEMYTHVHGKKIKVFGVHETAQLFKPR